MRILHVIKGRCNPWSANGVDNSVYHFTGALAALGHEVALIELTGKEPLPLEGVHRIRVPGEGSPLRSAARILPEIARFSPDVVHLHSVYTPVNTLVCRGLRRMGRPYVVTPHGGTAPQVMRRRAHLKYPYKLLFERPILNGARFVHAIGDAHFIRDYGVSAPVVEVPNGIDPATIPTALDRGLLARRFPELAGRRTFLYLGRLDKDQKGLDLVVEAMVRLRGRDFAVLFVGPDMRGHGRELARLARDRGVANLFFGGPVYGPEKFSLMAGADVFVHASRWEGGIPTSLLQAASLRLPCLLTPAADPRRRFEAHKAGITVMPDVESVCRALEAFLDMKDGALRAMGGNARRMMDDEFAWPVLARRLAEGYAAHV